MLGMEVPLMLSQMHKKAAISLRPRSQELLPANSEEKALAPLADEYSLANDQLLTRGSKIAGLALIGH